MSKELINKRSHFALVLDIGKNFGNTKLFFKKISHKHFSNLYILFLLMSLKFRILLKENSEL